MTAPLDPASASAVAELQHAKFESRLAVLAELAAEASPHDWQRDAQRWSARQHRSAADVHQRAAGLHALEATARRMYPTHTPRIESP